jgi:hypothetical protein
LEIVAMLSSRLRGATAFFALWISAGVAQTTPETPLAVQRPPAMEVSPAYFEQRLAAFGHWISHPVWGQVWQPDAGRNFRPYFYGYWQYTSDYGWLWVSNEPYGDIVYHYGRWVYDPNFGWLWVPGYIWGPSWVTWRETDDYIGWLPMPPGYQDFSLNNLAPSYGPADSYGYQYFYGSNFPADAFMGLWVFVPTQEFGRSDRRRYVFDKDRVRDLYRHSQDRTHYSHDRESDRIVDRSIDKDELERSTHRHFDTPQGKQFLRAGTPIVPVTEGQEIARRDRDRASGRSGVGAGASPPPQNASTGIAEQSARGIGRIGVPQFGAGPRGLGRRDASSTLSQTGAGPDQDAQNPTPQLPPFPRRESERALSRRNSTALGAAGIPPNAPRTELSRGAQRAPLPGVATPSAPQIGARPQYRVPGSDVSGAFPRGYGLNASSPLSVPPVFPGTVPPAMPPPAAPLRIQTAPSLPAVQSPPTVAAPQAVPQAGPQRGPRSGMGFGGP